MNGPPLSRKEAPERTGELVTVHSIEGVFLEGVFSRSRGQPAAVALQEQERVSL